MWSTSVKQPSQTISFGAYNVLTNVGTSYDAIAMSRGLGWADVDFTGVTRIDVGIRVNKIGTGTQDWQLWNETDAAELMLVASDAAAAGDNKIFTASKTTGLPTGVKRVRWRVKSSVGADDPVWYGGFLRMTY